MLGLSTTPRPAAARELLGHTAAALCVRMHGGQFDGQEVRLASAKISVGGATGCTLRLRSPRSLPLYFWILRGPEGCMVRRYAPQTLLNGAAFDEAELFDGDRLRIGAIELEIVSGAQPRPGTSAESNRASDDMPLDEVRSEAPSLEANEPPRPSDPWTRQYKRAFASRSSQNLQQRRSLRQHHARRMRRLIDVLRRQLHQVDALERRLDEQSVELSKRVSRHENEAERIQLEQEARQLTALVEQMQMELQLASVERSATKSAPVESGEQRAERERLQAEVERLGEALAKAREEAEQVRRSTAVQVDAMKRAFESVCQERDQLAGLEQLRGSEQPQLEQQIKFLNSELERRDRELGEARASAAAQNEKLLASLDQLREEMGEIQAVRQRERQQASAETQRFERELAELRSQLDERDEALRAAKQSAQAETMSLRGELERALADANHARQQLERQRSDATAVGTQVGQLEAELASLRQQLERRTADWQALQQSAAAEATQFSKTIEQLRSELRNERTLREQEVESRQADRQRSEEELSALRTAHQEREAELDAQHQKLQAEIQRLTLELDQAARAAGELEAQLASEQSRAPQPQALSDAMPSAGEQNAAQERLAELEQQLAESQKQIAELETLVNELDQSQSTMPQASGPSEDEIHALAEARQEIAAAREQCQAEREQWERERDTWEASLRQREEDLAAQVAELEQQVELWRERQSAGQVAGDVAPMQDQPEPGPSQLHQPEPDYTVVRMPEDKIYGSYSPPSDELPPDVTLPIPRRLDDEFAPPSDFNVTQQLAREFAAEVEGAAGYSHENPYADPVADGMAAVDQAESTPAEGEPERDSDSVNAVLARLMQAGLWHGEANRDELNLDSDEAKPAEPQFDHPVSSELPQEQSYDEPEAEDVALGHTMDASALMQQMGGSPRSWRAEMLGEADEAPSQPHEPADEPFTHQDQPATAYQSPHQELAEQEPSDHPLPEQAIGHGSWRAQLLGGAEEDQHESAGDMPSAASMLGSSSHFGQEGDYAMEPELPAPVAYSPPPAEASEAQAGGDDEDSIEAYMSKLLKRVRGDSGESSWSQTAATPAVAVEKPASKPAPVVQQAERPEPVDPSTYVPQRAAPEASTNLAAMREIANSAARAAIDMHAKRSHTQRFARRLLKAALALLTTAGFAVWGCYHRGYGPWLGVVVGLLLMAYWSAGSIWHFLKALRLKPALEAALAASEPVEPEATPMPCEEPAEASMEQQG